MKYNVRLRGKNWDNMHELAVLDAVSAVGKKIATILPDTSPEEAFRAVFGWLYIVNGGQGSGGVCTTITVGGCTTHSHQINFALNEHGSPNWAGDYVSENQFLRNRNNVVHELAHAFGSWNRGLGALVGGWDGFAPPSTSETQRIDWRMHPCAPSEDICSSETFADMFLGWTFGTWADTDMGQVRSTFMQERMPAWICAAADAQGCK